MTAAGQVYRSGNMRDAIIASEVATEQLVTLALTLPTAGGSELWGRSHAWYAIAHTQPDAQVFMGTVSAETERRRIAAHALALAGYAPRDVRALAVRMTARRVPEPGPGRYRYADTCANCGEVITGELIGILADGESISWRHRHGFAFGCGGRVDRLASEAIPAGDVDGECSIHGKITRYHRCEAGGLVRYHLTAAV